MAHYKRGKCRHQKRWKYPAQAFLRKRLGLRPVNPNHQDYTFEEWRRLWPDGTGDCKSHKPRWFDILWHSRPRRRKDKAECHRIIRGHKSADEAIWQIDGKPKNCY